MHLGSILGAPWSILAAFWEHFGSILDTSIFNQSFDAILDRFLIDSAPSDSLKLSSRLHEKQVFVKCMLIDFQCFGSHVGNILGAF